MKENRIILPLDNKSVPESFKIIEETSHLVWGYKLRRQILDEGIGIVRKIKNNFNTKIMVERQLSNLRGLNLFQKES